MDTNGRVSKTADWEHVTIEDDFTTPSLMRDDHNKYACNVCVRSHIRAFYDENTYQSEVVSEASTEQSLHQQQTVNFMDQNRGEDVGVTSSFSSLDTIDRSKNVELQEFLSRPVRIGQVTWNETDPIGTINTISPWYAYFNDSRIKLKLQNYAFIKCNLKIKILINASPFYYGAMIMSYNPLPTWNSNKIVTDTNKGQFIPYSQRPHLWILPQCNQGGTMSLPFFFPRNYFRTAVGNDFLNMGTLSFINYTALQSANGATGQGVNIQVFAWAEDVELSGPTIGSLLQADVTKDTTAVVIPPLRPKPLDTQTTKYDAPYPQMTKMVFQADVGSDGLISGPASAIANIASKLTSVPVIGRFARATEIGSSAISGIAKLFGYTNTPVIEYVKPMKIQAFPHLASPEISYPIEKLTLDPKNELTIDPTTTGANPDTDELEIKSIATKPSYLTTLTFADTNAVDDILFSSYVTPNLYQLTTVAGTSQKVVQMTPMSLCSQMFANWRGSIKYKFKFVCSKYHKARVRLTYDPYGTTDGNNIQSVAANTPVAFTEIIDITNDTEFEVTIPYMQSTTWLRTLATTGAIPQFSQTTNWANSSLTFSINDLQANGMLTLRVLTNLTAPISGTSIQCLVSVCAGDDIEFNNPISPPQDLNYFVYQNDVSKDDIGSRIKLRAGDTQENDDNRHLLYFGEKIVSFRQLLRRSCKLQEIIIPPSTTADIQYYALTQCRYPRFPGYDTNGFEQAKGILAGTTTSTFQYNWVQNTPYHLLAPCFGGQRGSMIWHFNPTGSIPIADAYVERRPDRNLTLAIGHSVGNTTLGAGVAGYLYTYKVSVSGNGGLAATNGNTNSMITTLVPPANRFRFQSTVPGAVTSPSLDDDMKYEAMVYGHTLWPQAQATQTDFTYTAGVFTGSTKRAGKSGYIVYFSIGTDYNLFFFLNVPSMYIYSGIPATTGTW